MENNKELLNSAIEYIKNKDFQGALEKLEKAIELDDSNLEALKNTGLCYVNLNNFEKAIISFEKAQELSPNDATVKFYIALIYSKINKEKEAIEKYKEVIELRPSYANAYKNLVSLCTFAYENEQAMAFAQKGIENAPDDNDLKYMKASLLLQNSEVDEAINILAKLKETQGAASFEVYNLLASAYILKHDKEKAIENFELALQEKPGDIDNLQMIAELYLSLNKLPNCIEAIRKILTIDKSKTDEAISIASSASASGKIDMAIAILKLVEEFDAQNVKIYYSLSNNYISKKDYMSALTALQKALNLVPDSEAIRIKIAKVYAIIGEVERAEKTLLLMLQKNKANFDIYQNLALLMVRINDIDRAEEYTKKAMVLEPENPHVQKDLGVIYLMRRQMDYAKECFDKAYSINPNDPEIIYECASFYMITGKHKEALELFQKLLSLEPNNPDYLLAIGMAYINIQKYEEALELLLKMEKFVPNNPICLYNLARAYYYNKEFNKALEVVAKLDNNIENLNLKGLCLMSLDDYNQAIEVYYSILKQIPDNINALVNTAKCHKNLGDTNEAITIYNKVLDKLPTNEESIYDLSMIYAKEDKNQAKAFVERFADYISDEKREEIEKLLK